MKSRLRNIRRRTPKKWRRIGNAAMFIALGVQPMFAGAPAEVMGEAAKFWASMITAVIGLGIKGYTETYAENNEENFNGDSNTVPHVGE